MQIIRAYACIEVVFDSNNLVAAAIGETSFDGVIYYTTATNVTGLLPPGSEHINHGAIASK